MPGRRSLLLPLVLPVVLIVGMAACSPAEDPAASGSPTTTTVTSGEDGAGPLQVDTADALSEVPDPIPDVPHGTLLKYQVVDGLVDGGVAYKVMYTSESVGGEQIVVTGQVVVPTAAPPESGWPVLATAHGTTGVADMCAPSLDPPSSEMARIGPVGVASGWVVTETDYEGLGTPGRHPYLVGASEGRGVIDSVLASRQLPDTRISGQVMIAGYSQGGHGALWANEVAAEWAPDLEVVGTFAGAPATELDAIFAVSGTLPIGGFVLSMVAGFEAAYPDADPATFLTDAGVALLGAVDEGCIGSVFGAASSMPPGELVRPDGPTSEPWAQLARDNNPGQVATDGPVLIIHSDQDEVVPVQLSAALHQRMCSVGQVVERRVLVGGGGHSEAAVPAYTEGLAWLTRMLAGEEPVTDC